MHDVSTSKIWKLCAFALGIVGVAVVLVGCSGDNSGTAPTSTTAVVRDDPATIGAITEAYVTLFNASAPVEQRMAAVEKGADFASVLRAQAANPQAQSTTATVSAVEIVDATHANVTYTLLMGGAPALPDQNGQAVKDGDRWKVAAMTFCALATLQGGEVPAC